MNCHWKTMLMNPKSGITVRITYAECYYVAVVYFIKLKVSLLCRLVRFAWWKAASIQFSSNTLEPLKLWTARRCYLLLSFKYEETPPLSLCKWLAANMQDQINRWEKCFSHPLMILIFFVFDWFSSQNNYLWKLASDSLQIFGQSSKIEPSCFFCTSSDSLSRCCTSHATRRRLEQEVGDNRAGGVW